MKNAKRLKILLVLALCLTVFSCDIFNQQKFADVIMVDGPRNEGGEATFSFVGTVRNIGGGKALFVRVYIELKNPDDILLTEANNLVDKTDLDSGESSALRVTFEDEGYEIRDLMDDSKTSFSITWSDEN
jgi:hypothetical protein